MRRADRIAGEIKKVVAEAMRGGIKDPRMPIIASVTEVKVNRDFSLATVYVSTIGDETVKKDMMACLEHASGYLKSSIGKKMRLRQMPELRFRLDESMEEGMRMSQLIDQVLAKDRARKSADEADER